MQSGDLQSLWLNLSFSPHPFYSVEMAKYSYEFMSLVEGKTLNHTRLAVMWCTFAVGTEGRSILMTIRENCSWHCKNSTMQRRTGGFVLQKLV